MAEREGFEPSKRFPVYTLSKRAPSTTRPPLQSIFLFFYNIWFIKENGQFSCAKQRKNFRKK